MPTLPLDLDPLPDLPDAIAPDRIVSGSPRSGVRSAYENEDAKGFYTGVWESSVGCWRVAYDEDELCVMLAGRARLTDAAGSRDYGPGDSFVIPRGFTGTWESLEPVRKIYAIAL